MATTATIIAKSQNDALTPSLRAQRSNPEGRKRSKNWIASLRSQ
ncbi:hypothetical protein [Tardiphaga alba]|nr:hypothetical protein [Tardiphaga alba]